MCGLSRKTLSPVSSTYLSLVGVHELTQILSCSVNCVGTGARRVVPPFLDDHDVFCCEHDLPLVGVHTFPPEVIHGTKHDDERPYLPEKHTWKKFG